MILTRDQIYDAVNAWMEVATDFDPLEPVSVPSGAEEALRMLRALLKQEYDSEAFNVESETVPQHIVETLHLAAYLYLVLKDYDGVVECARALNAIGQANRGRACFNLLGHRN